MNAKRWLTSVPWLKAFGIVSLCCSLLPGCGEKQEAGPEATTPNTAQALPTQVAVPRVLEMRLEDAADSLRGAGLQFEANFKEVAGVQGAQVVDQDPKAGFLAQEGAVVGLVVATALPPPPSYRQDAGVLSWAGAQAVCQREGKRLYSIAEVCGSDMTPDPGILPGDHWLAVSDGDNEWVSIGDAYPARLCKPHTQVAGSTPAWGKTSGYPTNAPTLFMCHSLVTYRQDAGVLSWAGAQAVCQREGKRLCSIAQVCGSDTTPDPGLLPGDHWLAVSDGDNEWVSIGNAYPSRLCKSHTQVAGSTPGWGKTSGYPTNAPTMFTCCRQ